MSRVAVVRVVMSEDVVLYCDVEDCCVEGYIVEGCGMGGCCDGNSFF